MIVKENAIVLSLVINIKFIRSGFCRIFLPDGEAGAKAK